MDGEPQTSRSPKQGRPDVDLLAWLLTKYRALFFSEINSEKQKHNVPPPLSRYRKSHYFQNTENCSILLLILLTSVKK